MAKTIKSRVEYQVNELVSNLNNAANTTSEQKRDFYTTRAMYNAKRLSTMINRAKIGAMAVAFAFGVMSCGGSQSTEVVSDSTNVVDTVAVQDTTKVDSVAVSNQ